MSNIAVRKNTGQYQPRDKGIYANDLNYLLSKAGNKANYRMNDAVGFNDGRVQDKKWLMEYSDSRSILLNLGFIWRNGRLCKQTDDYSGGLSQQLGDELNFVRVLESNIPVAKPLTESTDCTYGLTGSSSIWYVLMLSNDELNTNTDNWDNWITSTQVKNPAQSPNKYHVLKYTRDQIQNIYSGLPTHLDSCKKIIGCANFTEEGKLLNINNSFLKGDIKEDFTAKPWDIFYYDKEGIATTSPAIYVCNANIYDELGGKNIKPDEFLHSTTFVGLGGFTLVDLNVSDTNHIFVEYNPLGGESSDGSADIVCVASADLDNYLDSNPEIIKRMIWTISITGDFNDVTSFTKHFNDDIYISEGGSDSIMPFDCDFAIIEEEIGSETVNVKKIRVRNGGFYLNNNGNYRFVGQGVDEFGADKTIRDIENYSFNKFRYLTIPEMPSSADELKYIIWAGIDITSVEEECFVEIKKSTETPDRVTSILTPIAELNWFDTGEWAEPFRYNLNQLKRGFVYEEGTAEMPWDTFLESSDKALGIYACKVRCGGFSFTDSNGRETFKGINSVGFTVDFSNYQFNTFYDIELTEEQPVVCAFLSYEDINPDIMKVSLIPIDAELNYQDYFVGHTVVAKQPIAQLIIPEITIEEPEPEPYIIQLKRGFISYNLDRTKLPYDCVLTGAIGAFPELVYDINVIEGLFSFYDEDGVLQTVASGKGAGATLSDYDFNKITTIGLTTAKPIAAAVLYKEMSTGIYGADVGYFNRALEIDGWLDEAYYKILSVIPIAELKFDGYGNAYLNQLKRGFIHLSFCYPDDLQNLVFRVENVGGVNKLQCYISSSDKYYDVVYYNGEPISENDTALSIGLTPGWLDVKTSAVQLPSVGSTQYIYFSIKRISSGAITDYSSPADVIWTLGSSNAGYDDWWNNVMILASVTNSDGEYKVRHYRKGTIYIESRLGDATNFYAVGNNARFKQRSVDVIGGYGSNFSTELYNFSAQTVPTEDITSLNFVTTESFTGGTKQICYLPASDLFDYIDTLIPPPVTCDDLSGCVVGWLDEYFWNWFCGEIGTTWVGEGDPPWQCLIDLIDGKSNHKSLIDIVAGTDTDDHVDSTRLVGATATVSYLNLDGDATRNSFSENAFIGDKNGLQCIWPNYRCLLGQSQEVNAAWGDFGFSVDIGDYWHEGLKGDTGSFTSQDGKTITVSGGIITGISSN